VEGSAVRPYAFPNPPLQTSTPKPPHPRVLRIPSLNRGNIIIP
jgi:hypothetical protein